MSNRSLAIRIDLRSTAPVSGRVVLINRGNKNVYLWKLGNSWGDETLSFEVTRDGQIQRVVRKQQEYTRNVPSSVLIAPSGSYEIPFDFGDGSWEPKAVIDRLGAPDTRLTAIYHVGKSPEAVFHNIWMGRLRSRPLRLD